MASIEEIARDTVELNRSGRGEEAGERHWADDVVSVEAMEGPMARVEGKEAVMGKSRWWLDNHTVHEITAEGPYVNGDQFIVHYGMDVTPKGGERRKGDEMGVYTVKNGKIAEERFYYGRS